MPLNQDWLALTALGTDAFGLTTTVPTRIPPASAFTALTARPPRCSPGGGGSTRPQRGPPGRGPIAADHPARPADASHYGLPMTHPQQVAGLVRGT